MNPIRSLALTALLFSGLLAALAVGPLGFWRGHTDFDVWLSRSGQALVAGYAYLAARRLPHPSGIITRVGGLHITASVMLVVFARQLVRLVFGRSPGVTLASDNIHVRSLVDNLSIAVRAPITEELLFRFGLFVVLCAGFTRWRTGTLMAAVISGMLFGAAHVPQEGWVVMVPTALGGMIYVGAYQISGSLWAPLLAHMIGNATRAWETSTFGMILVAMWTLSVGIFIYTYRDEHRSTLLHKVVDTQRQGTPRRSVQTKTTYVLQRRGRHQI